MSIQASWNRIMGTAAAVTTSNKLAGMIKPSAAPQKFDQMSAEELATYAGKNNPEDFNKAVNGIQERLVSKYGVSQEDAQRLADDIRLGKGEGWTSRFDEARLMAQRAREAAQEADDRPVNNITTAEEALKHLEEIKNQTQGGNV